MKNYLIILDSGQSCNIEAKDEESLFRKIDSGHYGMLPVRGTSRIIVTRNNIKEIIEQKEEEKSQLETSDS